MREEQHGTDPNSIRLPRPTMSPLALALGLSLIMAGLVTSIVIGLLGLVLTIVGIAGWFRQVLPYEAHEAVPVSAEEVTTTSDRTLIERHHTHVSRRREILPIQNFSILTGIRGGIAGGAAMTLPAALFGLLKYHSVWYSINLLAAGGFVSWAGASDAFLSRFHLQGLLAGLIIHGLTSLLVGLLYGAMLPIFPKYPIVTAGIMVPLIFTGIQYTALGIVSPILDQRIDWFWFVISQIAFGLVCGFVVNLRTRVRTPEFQALPFAVRAGLHTSAEQEPTPPSEIKHDERDRHQ